MENNVEADFFQKYGLEVSSGEVQVGQTYPIYAMITSFINDTPGKVVVELNFSIKAHMSIPDQEKIELLKERSFEPGIFVSTIKEKESEVVVECNTVVFGRRHEFNA